MYVYLPTCEIALITYLPHTNLPFCLPNASNLVIMMNIVFLLLLGTFWLGQLQVISLCRFWPKCPCGLMVALPHLPILQSSHSTRGILLQLFFRFSFDFFRFFFQFVFVDQKLCENICGDFAPPPVFVRFSLFDFDEKKKWKKISKCTCSKYPSLSAPSLRPSYPTHLLKIRYCLTMFSRASISGENLKSQRCKVGRDFCQFC